MTTLPASTAPAPGGAAAGGWPSRAARLARRRRPSQRLAHARACAAELLARHRDALPDAARYSVVSAAQITSTGMAVVALAPEGETAYAVLKLPLTPGAARGLRRESTVLDRLHGEARLGDWRQLLPEPLAGGILGAAPYRIDAALVGRHIPARRVADDSGGGLVRAAAETIATLHRATATSVPAALDVGRLWVDAPARELKRHLTRRGARVRRLERLQEELREAVAGTTLRAGWIHGDYWLGNLLFLSPESGGRSDSRTSVALEGGRTPALVGIVDWDSAAPLELPLHDVLHLLLYSRRLVSDRELGQIIAEQLLGGAWSAVEADVLARFATWRDNGGLSDRHALLLYWLRHVAMHSRQQSSAGYRYRVWERRNVLAILDAL